MKSNKLALASSVALLVMILHYEICLKYPSLCHLCHNFYRGYLIPAKYIFLTYCQVLRNDTWYKFIFVTTKQKCMTVLVLRETSTGLVLRCVFKFTPIIIFHVVLCQIKQPATAVTADNISYTRHYHTEYHNILRHTLIQSNQCIGIMIFEYYYFPEQIVSSKYG
jgi:hypothetical protein